MSALMSQFFLECEMLQTVT